MRRLSGYSEKWLENKLAAGLQTRGLLNFHMSDPTKPGIPDRYVVGGRWIEVKQGKTFGEIARGFDRQRVFLDKLAVGGDLCFVCALHQPNNYTFPLLYAERWTTWKLREQDRTELFGRVGGSPFQISDMKVLEAAWDHMEWMIRGR